MTTSFPVSALAQATHIKQSFRTEMETTMDPVDFNRDRDIHFREFAASADKEYRDFLNMGPHITHGCTVKEELLSWIDGLSVEDLAQILERAPDGCAAGMGREEVVFTPWQRLAIVFYTCLPFHVESKVHISELAMEQMNTFGAPRKMPFDAQAYLLKGSFPHFGIVDLPTAAGKTAFSLAIGYMAIAPARYSTLVQEYRRRRLHDICVAPPNFPVARLVIVATTPTTFHHFETTLHCLSRRFKEPVSIWTSVGKHTSTLQASLSDRLTFWILPVQKLNKVLREHPEVAVAMCIIDEYTVDTPRQQCPTGQSPVLRTLITQATPHALVKATSGRTSTLREHFDGQLIPPNKLPTLVQEHAYKDASVGCLQRVKLDMMTVLNPFRHFVRNDLEHLVPSCMRVILVRSRRVTLTSHLNGSQSDMLPENFRTTFQRMIAPMGMDDTWHQRAMSLFDIRPMPLSLLVDTLERFMETRDNNAHGERLVQRIKEFQNGCPLCMDEHSTTMNLFPCCGYCVCGSCHDRLQRRACPFCRTALPATGHQALDLTEPDTVDAPSSILTFEPELDLRSLIARDTDQTRPQMENFTACLRALVATGHRRPTIFLECTDHHRAHFFMKIVEDEVRKAGIRALNVTSCSGKGTLFSQLKNAFDDLESYPEPVALLMSGMQSQFLIGSNLDYADSMVFVGRVSQNIITQACGRIFRPRASRDNTKPVPVVRVFSPL